MTPTMSTWCSPAELTLRHLCHLAMQETCYLGDRWGIVKPSIRQSWLIQIMRYRMKPPVIYHHSAQLLPLADIKVINTHDQTDITPLYLSLPHGGRAYPAEILAQGCHALDRFRSLEDIGTDLLVSVFANQGCSVVAACLSRALIDVNRPADAFDSALYQDNIPSHQDQDDYRAYITSGYGVMPRLSAKRTPLYVTPPNYAIACHLRDRFHTPYHQQLQRALTQRQRLFGHALLVDVHSMPGQAHGKSLPDIIFGDCHGRSLPPLFRKMIDRFMAQTGLSHAWNYPYAGGYITKHYGDMHGPTFALQIEINRRLYVAKPHAVFDDRLHEAKLLSLGRTITALTTELTMALPHLSAAQ